MSGDFAVYNLFSVAVGELSTHVLLLDILISINYIVY